MSNLLYHWIWSLAHPRNARTIARRLRGLK